MASRMGHRRGTSLGGPFDVGSHGRSKGLQASGHSATPSGRQRSPQEEVRDDSRTSPTSLYDTLELQASATEEEVRSAYKRLALRHA